MKKARVFNKLNTVFELKGGDWDMYPRPQLKRDSFFSLCGEWEFFIKSQNDIKRLKNIVVPFPPESTLSGIEKTFAKSDSLIYKKRFSFPQGFIKDRVILHFGAVDQTCVIYLNGNKVGENFGGYLPFSFDVTDAIAKGENCLEVQVFDSLSKDFGYGKQRTCRGGMWYTPVSGIWQPVWLESVAKDYIKTLRITPTTSSVTIVLEGGEGEKHLQIEGQNPVTFLGNQVTVEIANPKTWSPDSPYLYNFTLSTDSDQVCSYFALREMGVKEIDGKNYITLNGKPVFLHALLDQGYFPDGIFTPSTPKAYEFDVVSAKELGFNCLRKHIKLEPDLFYYYCDLHGVIVMQDMINSGRYSFVLDTALPTIGLKRGVIKRATKRRKANFMRESKGIIDALYNHPSVCYYTIFNEGWGQFDADKVYKQLKSHDQTRIFDTTSGWFFKKLSDVDSHHVYFKKINLKAKKRPLILSEFGGYSYKIEKNSFNPYNNYGYKTFTSKIEFEKGMQDLYDNINQNVKNGLNGAVLTQLTDVEDETNGLLTYDRQVLKIDKEKMQEIAKSLFETFREQTSQKEE